MNVSVIQSMKSKTEMKKNPKILRRMEEETVVFCSDLEPFRAARLLFHPVKILHVENAGGTLLFEENEDYVITSDGTLLLTESSRIPTLQYYSVRGQDDHYYRFNDVNGKAFYSSGGNDKHDLYDIVVTYTYAESSLDALYKGSWESGLTSAIAALKEKQPVNIAFFGDSITAGLQAVPDSRAYAPRLVSALKEQFGYDNLTYINKAVSGKTSVWGLQGISGVMDACPDLVVLAFGMNDASGNVSSAQYKENMELMITRLRAANPDVSIILVAEFSPNPAWEYAHYELRSQNRDALFDLYLKYKNTAFVDVGAVSRQIQARKKFQDFSANNLNHPNNFMYKVYAELILQVFVSESQI